MDALKFLKTAKRMCNKRGQCTCCPIHDFCNNDFNECSDALFIDTIKAVEQYNKDHPAKENRKDRLLRSIPNSPINANGDPDLCPEDYGEDNYYDNGLLPCEIFNSECATCKHEYWSEEPHGPAYWDKYWEEDYGR